MEMLSDQHEHVALAAIDALGNCPAIEAASTADRRSPYAAERGSWRRESHALVALAKRSRRSRRSAAPLALAAHVWQVRMYAARAAAIANHMATLERLAADDTTTSAKPRSARCGG